MSKSLCTLAAGGGFGAALTASRVYLPSTIINQMRLADWHMLEVFVTAVSSSALIMVFIERTTSWRRPVRTNSNLTQLSPHDGNIAGGALIGLGMSLAGACPGTVLVQVAQDIPSSRGTMLGALLGGIAYSRLLRWRHQTGSSMPAQRPRARTITQQTQISERMLLATFAVLLGGLVAFARPGALSPQTLSKLSPLAGGLLIGLAQALSILLTSSTLSASGVYEQMGRYFWSAFGAQSAPKPARDASSIIFSLGIMGGSVLLTALSPATSIMASTSHLQLPVWRAILGGFALSFGARCAGGCTSGHGLSGVATLSWSSVITVASMFGAGVVSQALISRLV